MTKSWATLRLGNMADDHVPAGGSTLPACMKGPGELSGVPLQTTLVAALKRAAAAAPPSVGITYLDGATGMAAYVQQSQ